MCFFFFFWSQDELQKRNEVIRAISKRLKMADLREQDSLQELSSIRQQMQELSQKQQHSSEQHRNLVVKVLFPYLVI